MLVAGLVFVAGEDGAPVTLSFAGNDCARGLHSTLWRMMPMARSEMSLVRMLRIGYVIAAVTSFPRDEELTMWFQVAGLNAGWCLSAKSRHTPGMSPLALYAASRLNVPLPAIGSMRAMDNG